MNDFLTLLLDVVWYYSEKSFVAVPTNIKYQTEVDKVIFQK